MNGFQGVKTLGGVPDVNLFTGTSQGRNKDRTEKSMPTVERVHELLTYNPETGVFVWKARTSNRIHVGDRAGRDNRNGYRRINIDGSGYYEHRIAWLYVYGKWPKYEIDHKDGVGFNNQIANLREATHIQNSQNMPLSEANTSGMRGVSWCKNYGKWEAYIWLSYRKISLGYFDSLYAAGEAYLKAKQKLHSFQPNQRST